MLKALHRSVRTNHEDLHTEGRAVWLRKKGTEMQSASKLKQAPAVAADVASTQTVADGTFMSDEQFCRPEKKCPEALVSKSVAPTHHQDLELLRQGTAASSGKPVHLRGTQATPSSNLQQTQTRRAAIDASSGKLNSRHCSTRERLEQERH